MDLKTQVAEFERRLIAETIQQHPTRRAAAQALGISLRTLFYATQKIFHRKKRSRCTRAKPHKHNSVRLLP